MTGRMLRQFVRGCLLTWLVAVALNSCITFSILRLQVRTHIAKSRSTRHASAPKEFVDLLGMKTKELKTFLKENGVYVDDCFDMESLMQRAQATESDWAKRDETPVVSTSSASAASSNEYEAAWARIEEAWPGKSLLELGPSDADASVILLHGFGDADARFLSDTFSVVLKIKGVRLLFPQAPEETLQNSRYQTWFLPTNNQWIVDDAVAAPVVAYAHAMIRREIARGVRPERILLGGFAQGVGCALRAALSFPDASLGGAMAISGFFGSDAAMVSNANRALPIFVGHGKSDDVVPFSEGERSSSVLQKLSQGPVTFNWYDMKHGVASDELTDMLEFIDRRLKAAEAEPTQDEPLRFDPVDVSKRRPRSDERQAFRVRPGTKSDEGVPKMEPSLVLDLLQDPEIASSLKDPEVMAVIQDVIMNPSNLEKHQGNPRVANILERLLEKMGST